MTENKSGERYRHVQPGWLMMIVGSVVMTLGLWGFVVTTEATLVCFGLGTLMILLFGWLTVAIVDGEVRISFGIGLIRRQYALSEFMRVQVVRNKWYYGWGDKMVAGMLDI